MRGNSFGRWLGIYGFGESHGKAVGVLIEDIKPGVKFPLAEIQKELDRRRPDQGEFTSSRKELDKIEVLSGVIDGKTTGMPICMIVYNKDQRSKDYQKLENIFRPGHADWSWYKKFKILDWRGGGRASGRETIARVAAGAVVKDLLGNIKITAYTVQIGQITASYLQEDFNNLLYWPDSETYDQVLNELSKHKENGDSLGGIIELRINGLPAGLGDPVFAKLDARLSEAILSIGGVKGIEFGKGFQLAGMSGSEANDQMSSKGFISNNHGGIQGGISTGKEVVIRIAVKPTSSIRIKQKTIDIDGKEREIMITGRHDTCIVFRIIPVVKAMTRLALADCISYQKLVDNAERDMIDYREALDKIDEDILLGIKRRHEIVKLIGKYKKENKMKISDISREKKLIEKIKIKARLWELDHTVISRIWEKLISYSKKEQKRIIDADHKPDTLK